MNIMRTTSEVTVTTESIRPAARTFVTTAALVVIVHTFVMLVHGAAHMRLNIELAP